MRKIIIATAAAILMAQPAFAWGDKGHEIIAAIARSRLTPQAQA